MPATPVFSLSQDEGTVFVKIRVPYVRVGSMETHVDGCDFSFYCKPFLLRLQLPHRVVDTDKNPAKAVYDPDENNGTVTVHLPKETRGKHFDGLDMLTRLLSKQPTREGGVGGESKHAAASVAPSTLIQEITTANELDNKSGVDGITQTLEQISVECNASTDSSAADKLLNKVSYGFGNRYSGVFSALRDELFDLVELPNPDLTPAAKRSALRAEHENSAFDWQRYGSDGCVVADGDDPLAVEAMRIRPYWSKPASVCDSRNFDSPTVSGEQTTQADAASQNLISSINEGASNSGESSPSEDLAAGCDFDGFTERELEIMRQLPRRNYEIQSETARQQLLYGVCDILFGYAYDYRTTSGGDPTAESNWTIAILSPLLSWLDPPESCRDVVVRSVRRAICYPYLRCWAFCEILLKDVESLLRSGQHYVLRAFLATRDIFAKSESRYLLNRLWIDDYCVWLQTPNVGAQLGELADEYAQARIALSKNDFQDWKLTVIEKCFADMRIVAAAEGTNEETGSSSSSSDTSDEEHSDEGEEDTEHLASTKQSAQLKRVLIEEL